MPPGNHLDSKQSHFQCVLKDNSVSLVELFVVIRLYFRTPIVSGICSKGKMSGCTVDVFEQLRLF